MKLPAGLVFVFGILLLQACVSGHLPLPSSPTSGTASGSSGSPSGSASTVSGTAGSSSSTAVAGLSADAAKADLSEQYRSALSDFKTGAALGISVVLGDTDSVLEASVVDKNIVVTKRAKDQPRAAFEVHQLFTTNPLTAKGRAAAQAQLRECGADPITCPMFGIGPFAAIQTGNDDTISSVGIGLMVGVRSNPRQNKSFNLGVGIAFDGGVRRLAKGFTEGKPLPPGESSIRFEDRSARRLMITLAFSF